MTDQEAFDKWMAETTEKHDRSTAASIRKARKEGTLGSILASRSPKVRKRIHDLDRRYNGSPR